MHALGQLLDRDRVAEIIIKYRGADAENDAVADNPAALCARFVGTFEIHLEPILLGGDPSAVRVFDAISAVD